MCHVHAIARTGHGTESVYRRYAVSDEPSLIEAAVKLAALHARGQMSAGILSGLSKSCVKAVAAPTDRWLKTLEFVGAEGGT